MNIEVRVKTAREGVLLDYLEGILADGTEVVFDWDSSDYEDTDNGFLAVLQHIHINGKYAVELPENIDTLVLTSVQFYDGEEHSADSFPATIESLSFVGETDTVTLTGPLFHAGLVPDAKEAVT